ncbi:MAG: thioesterase family protein [Gemmatimonadota bacterium]
MSHVEPISSVRVRVNYSETDQMGVVYHANYVIWLDIARTEHLRQTGVTYAELERQGIRLAVGRLQVRYIEPAKYDDEIVVRCWVRDAGSRRISFGYAVDHADGRLLATAVTDMYVLDAAFRWTRLPAEVKAQLEPVKDPVRVVDR